MRKRSRRGQCDMDAVTRPRANPNAAAGASSSATTAITVGVTFCIAAQENLLHPEMDTPTATDSTSRNFGETWGSLDTLAPWLFWRSPGSQKQNWHADSVLHAVCGCAQKHVGKKAVSMGAHRDQIAAFLLDPLHDFVSGVAVGELGVSGNSCGYEFFAHAIQIRGVFGNLRTHGIGSVGPGSPSVGDMQEHQPAVGDVRQLLDMFNDGAIACSAIQRHQNPVVHGFQISSRSYPPTIKCHAVLIESGRP